MKLQWKDQEFLKIEANLSAPFEELLLFWKASAMISTLI
ncbi:MAG: hypothetical protein KR126chlam3_01410 [Chlamydiae bacterium]|nr:hypothetical protein [Chlamydiota bacterium]